MSFIYLSPLRTSPQTTHDSNEPQNARNEWLMIIFWKTGRTTPSPPPSPSSIKNRVPLSTHFRGCVVSFRVSVPPPLQLYTPTKFFSREISERPGILSLSFHLVQFCTPHPFWNFAGKKGAVVKTAELRNDYSGRTRNAACAKRNTNRCSSFTRTGQGVGRKRTGRIWETQHA